ncbi:MAG: tetratricopeptide repeat protein [Spirochaetaceae bacterium]|jgi:tetratricopeptide (TPR) repeat protein|nr:tetratricopeptide repeat protein [Spirochaetaceae bacterium]
MEFKIVNQNALFGKTIPEAEFRKTVAQLYIKYNQPEEALKEYLLLVKLEPGNAEYYYNIGSLFEKRERSDQAIGYYQKAIELNPKHIKAHAAMGLLLYRGKQIAEAKKEIHTAISLDPNAYSSYYYLGKILKESKDYVGAVNAFEKSMRDPEYRQKSMIERGICYFSANNTEKAEAEFERAISATQDEASPDTLYARYFLASCYEKAREIDKAIAQWQKIYAKKRGFKDVADKLAQYSDLQANDQMKEYLTSSSEDFIKICTRLALVGFNQEAKDTASTKFGCRILATEAKSAENWMNVRQQTSLLLFYRDTELIEDAVLRSLLEEMKAKNINKSIVLSSAGFSRPALSFAENRPIELVGKEKLELLLEKAGADA